MAVANYNSNSLSVFINNGDGTFAAKVDYATGSNPHAVTADDFDGDGNLDIAVANNASNTMSIFTNNGDGTFAAKVDYSGLASPYDIQSGDLNGDGRPEMVVVNSSSISIFANNGDGVFGAKVDYTTASQPRAATIGDFNNDGRNDIVVASYSGYVSVFINNTSYSRIAETSTGTLSIKTSSSTDGGIYIQGSDNQQASLLVIQDSSGNGLLNVDAAGNLRVKGFITGGVGNPDYAENITVSDPTIEAADVVSMDPSHPEHVVKSSTPYDSTALGVISTSPGFVTNASEPDSDDTTQRPLALSGRVPVKVTDENGAILPGDYLTSSSTPGYAMKATQPGAVIGRAMAPFNGHKGKVLLFIDNSYYDPTDASHMQGGDGLFANLTINGNIAVDGNLTVGGLTSVQSIRIGGHIVSAGETPAVMAGKALGITTSALSSSQVLIDGTDTAGTISVTAGDTQVADGVMADLQFANSYQGSYKTVISPTNDAATDIRVYIHKTSTGFEVITKDVLQPNAVYRFDYIVVGTNQLAANTME